MLLHNRRQSARRESYIDGGFIDRMGTNVYSSKDNQSLHKSLNGEFILYQLLFDQIVDENKPLSFDQWSISKYFQPDDPNDQNAMNQFDLEYQSSNAIHWYTKDTCIYKILNRALRTQNIDDVAALSQFVRDLYRQLKIEQQTFAKKQNSSILILYRGQLISKDELTRLQSTKGELISMNSFLSTSRNRNKAIEFAKSRPPPNDQLTTIILEIYVNIRSPSRPLADIKHLSAFAEEEEILFMFGSVFRIDDVWFDEQNQIWNARFTLCGESDEDMKLFLSSLDQELIGQNKLISLGNYFIQIQKYQEAEEHYQNLLNDQLIKDNIELAYCHHGLSQVYDKKNNFKSAINHLNITIDYLNSTNDHPLISQSYNDLGSIYTKEENYLIAIQSYEKALELKNNILSNTYSGLSQIQFKLHNFILAEEYLEKALENQPETAHAAIANHYIDMGKIAIARNDKDKAAQMLDKAIQSQLKVLTADHPDLGYTYIAFGLMYSQVNDEEKAFEFIEKAHQLQKESLPGNHPDFVQTYRSFSDLYIKKGDFDQALIYQHQALDNQLKTLLWDHPQVAETHRIIGSIHWKKKDHEKALIYFHKVLDSELSRKKFGDPTLSKAFENVGNLYFEINNIDQALIYFLKFLENELEIKLYEDISLAEIYRRIASIYYKKRQLSEALLYFNRSIDCYLRKEPLDEDLISQIYSSIGKVYLRKHDFQNTLLYYQTKYSKQTENKSNEHIANKGLIKSKLLKSEYLNIEHIHFEQRHLDQQLNYFSKYLFEQITITSEYHPIVGNIYQILANICLEKKNFNQALDYSLKLLKNQLKRKSIDHSSLTNIYKAIGSIYLEKHLLDKALIYFNRLIDCRMKKKKSYEELSVIQGYQFVGKVYLAKHHFDQTCNYLNKSIQTQTNLTDLQFEKRHLDRSLVYFHNLLDKYFKSQSLKYFSLGDLYTIIANLFLEKRDPYRAIISFNHLYNYQLKENLPTDFLANTYAIIGNVYLELTNFDQALQYYQYAINFCQQNHTKNQFLIRKLKHRIREIMMPHI